MESFYVIGLMSGTSMDGLDIAFVHFTREKEKHWNYKLLHSETFGYPDKITDSLRNAPSLSALQLELLNKDLGILFAKFVKQFIKKYQLTKKNIDLIASHGHTVFHQPDKGITLQIGSGAYLAALTGIKTVSDFRTKDVVYGGQGAPLVPIGDLNLFHNEAESFLNIGGFCNISFLKEDQLIAFDICPGNLPLNKLANNKNLPYDKNGELSKKGEINFFLLNMLNELDYYQQEKPKSLGTEWLEQHFYPLIKFDKDIENNLRTLIEHIASQISSALKNNGLNSVFITGGGAHNAYLIERIQHYYKGKIIIPSTEIINFKEAIIFGFLGVLRTLNVPNCVASVTGAKKSVSGGLIHLP